MREDRTRDGFCMLLIEFANHSASARIPDSDILVRGRGHNPSIISVRPRQRVYDFGMSFNLVSAFDTIVEWL